MKKKLLLIPIFIAALIVTGPGCGSNNPVNNPNAPGAPDTSYVNYIIITPPGGVPDTLHFTDRNHTTGYYTSSSNSTYCLLNDTISAQSVSLSFDGSATGSPAFTFGFLSYQGGSYSATTISGTVTLYEAVGGKIKGTFNGTFAGSSSTYQCKGEFTVYRRP